MDIGIPAGVVGSTLVEEYMRLIGAVIKLGVKEEGPEYFRTLGGYYWCSVGGIDPKAAWEKAARGA